MAAKNDYVRARYVVVQEETDISVESVLRFTRTIRQGVIAALVMNDAGRPQSKFWLGELPKDYPPVDREPSAPDGP